jgi:hypothetical protein
LLAGDLSSRQESVECEGLLDEGRRGRFGIRGGGEERAGAGNRGNQGAAEKEREQ